MQYAAHNIGYYTILITTFVGLDHVALNDEQQNNLHGVIFDGADNQKIMVFLHNAQYGPYHDTQYFLFTFLCDINQRNICKYLL